MKKIVVAGAVGVIGRAILAHYDRREDVSVIALSRRSPDFDFNGRHIAVDLLDEHACAKALAELDEVTHVVFAAYLEQATLAAQVPPNLAMLRNVVTVLQRVSPKLEHVTLMQGGKAYGCHIGPFKTPGKESDPRHMLPNFYYDQEDFLRAESQGKRWNWTALRPEAVIGMAVGNPMNLLTVIAVYAAISKELGLPLAFPGPRAAYDALYQVTDGRILASATEWAGDTPACAGEVFNITNGDYFRWANMWPHIAAFFDMPAGHPLPIDLRTMMADKAPLWSEIVKAHGLRPYAYADIAAWGFGDFIFKATYDNITSTIKARRHGFQDCIDSEEMFIEMLRGLQEAKVIPSYS